MPKYYKKKYYRGGSRDKYSVEQTAITTSLSDPSSTTSVVVVPAVTMQGMRKVKHLTISLASQSEAFDALWWALVYVPQGTAVGDLSVTSGTSLYEPNQFVMNCGCFDFTAGPVRVSSPVSRNLNSGDAIYLVLRQGTSSSTAQTIRGVVKYAITLQ